MKNLLTSLAFVALGASAAHAANGTWTNNGNSTWSTTANWAGNTVADGAGFLADYSTIDITANRTVTLDSSRTIGGLSFADITWTNSGFGWTLASSGGSILTLDNTGGPGGNPPTITAVGGSNTTTSISAVLASTNGLSIALPSSNYDTTRGTTSASSGLALSQTAASLQFSANNTLSGALAASGGMVRMSGAGNFGNATALSVTGNGQFFNGDATAATNNGVTNRIGNGTATLTLGGASGAGTFTSAFAASANTTSQTFAGLTVNAGQNVLNTSNTAAGTNNLIFTGTGGAGYVRNTNGLLNIATATGFTPQFTNAPTAAGGSSVSGAGGDAILIGAILNGSNFIAAASGNVGNATYVTTLTADKNVNVTGNLSTSGNLSINSLRLGDATKRTVTIGASDTLTIASGGILLPSSMTTANISHTITGGSLTSGQGDLSIYSASGSTGINNGNGNPRAASYSATIASKITGAISLTVGGGTAQILLSGANDYTGGTYLENGFIAVNADSGLGSTSGIVTAVSGVNNIAPTAAFTFDASRNFVINSGALLQFGDRNLTNTIAGQISGGGQLGIGFVSAGQRLILTGNNTGFTGQYLIGSILQAAEGMGLSSNANLLFNGRSGSGVGTLETSGSFTRALGSGAGQVQWQAAGQFGSGGFAAVGGALNVNIGGNVTPDTLTYGSGYFLPTSGEQLLFGSSASTHDVTFQNSIALNGAQRGIWVNANGTTKAILSGTLTGNATSGINKLGTGTLVLTGNNTYQGATTVTAGTLSVASLNSVTGGTASSSLGAPTTEATGKITIGANTTTGTLLYTGAGETTDRTIQIGSGNGTGSGSITNIGSGNLVFTAANFNAADTSSVSGFSNRTITLNSTANIEIHGAIINNTNGTVSLTAAGTGTLTLSGNNTYTGTTTVSGGALKLGSSNALSGGIGTAGGTSALTFNGGILGLGNGDFTRSLASAGTATGVNFTGSGGWFAYGADRTVNLGGSGASVTWATANTGFNGQTLLLGHADGTHTIDLQNALDLGAATRTVQVGDGSAAVDAKLSGNITGSGGGLTKTGAGTLLLSGVNTYTGNTTISAGTLAVSGGNDRLATTGNITIGASGTLDLGGNTQTTTGVVTFTSGATLIGGTLTSDNAALAGNNFFTGTLNLGADGAFVTNRRLILATSGTSSLTIGTGSTGSITFGGDNSTNMNYVGVGGNGTLTINGGTVNFNNATFGTGNGYLNVGANSNASTGSIVVNGGNINVGTWLKLGGNFANLAGTNATSSLAITNGTVTLGGGSDTTTNGVLFMNGGNGNNTVNTGNSTLTLNSGGVLNAKQIQAGNQGTKTINFDGGTLRAGGNSTTFLNAATGLTVNVKDGGATIDTQAFDITVAAALVADGTGGLTKNGAGILTLSGNNTYTGGTTISAGTIEIGAAGRLGAGSYAGAISNNASLIYSGTSAQTLSGVISGTGALTQNASSTLTLSGANTYSGGTTINAGTLSLNNSGAIGNSGTITFGGGILQYTANNTTDYSSRFSTAASQVYRVDTNSQSVTLATNLTSSGGNLTKTGAGTLTLSGANTYSGATTVSAGMLSVTGSISNSATTVASGATLTGTGTVGAITLSAGALVGAGIDASSVGKLSGTSLTIGAGTGYVFTIGNVDTSVAGTDYDQIALTGAVTLSNTAASPFTVYLNGTPTGWSNTGIYSFDIINAASRSGTFTAGNFTTNTASFGGNTTGGTWSFSNPSSGLIQLTYAGSVGNSTWNTGTGDWGTAAQWVENTAPVDYNSLTYNGTLGGVATNNISNATLTTVNNITFAAGAGAYTLNASTGAAGAAGGTALELTGTINNNSSNNQTINSNLSVTSLRTVNPATGNMTLGGDISGSGGLTQTGNNSLTLSGANTFTGGLIVNGGGDGKGVVLASNTAAGNGTITLNGGSGNLGSQLSLNNGVTISNNLTLSGGILRANLASVSGTSTYSGNISVTGSNFIFLNRNGLGTLQITGPISGNLSGGNGMHTHTGSVNISGNINLAGTSVLGMFNGGTLTLSGSNTFGSFNMVAGGTLNINHANALGTGTVTLAGAGILNNTSGAAITLAGNNAQNWNGNFTFTGTNDLNMGTGAVTMNASRAVTITAGNFTVGGTISGASFGLTKAGSGTLILTGNNTYTGTTTISAGALNIQNASALGSTAAGTTVNSGAALQIQGDIAVGAEALTLSGSGSSNAGALRNISGTNSLAGAITLSGATTIGSDAGTLTLSGGISGTQNLTLVGAGNTTLSGSIATSTGTLTKNGSGTATLSAANTYTGSTTINSGTLAATTANALGGSTVVNINGGSLLVTAGDAINDSAAINLGGGVLAVNGTFDESVGLLTLSSNSVINLDGFSGVLRFGGVGSWASGATLAIWNWSGTTQYGTQINNYANPSHVVFTDQTGLTGNLGKISFFSGSGTGFIGNAFGQSFSQSGFATSTEIIAVPEPETYASAIILLLGLGIHAYRTHRRRTEQKQAQS